MATVTIQLLPESAAMVGTVFPSYTVKQGTSFPVTGLYYDDSLDEQALWKFRAANYGSGNLTLDIEWYAVTATAGNVDFSAQIAAITPDTDSQDVETKAFAAANTVTDSHLGTTARRIQRATIAVSNIDSLASDDLVFVLLERTGSSGTDTLVGDIVVTNATLSYSDV